MSAPERVYLQGDASREWGPQWKCWPLPMMPYTAFPATEYVRADLLTAAQAEIERLTAERDAAMAGRVKVRPLVINDPHRFAVVSADYSRPFLLGTYPELENAKLAQCGSPEKWHIFEKLPATQPDAERAEPVAWLPDVAYNWLKSYDGTACARMTAVHRAPLKDGSGVPLYTTPQPAPAPQAREITVQNG